MKAFLERGLPYEEGSIGSVLPEICSTGFGSRSNAVYLGLKVLPMNFSPDGDLGGV
jgi:hypothetical protein